MNVYEMIIGLALISGIVSIFRAKYGIVRRKPGEDHVRADNGENERLRAELRALKERVAVLERIATENDRGLSLDREIEALRHRD